MTARIATREDRRVVRRAHTTGYLALSSINALGDAVRVPGVGLVVNDAALIRQILLDDVHFAKVGPGGSSELWTPVIGGNALLNMDGPAHTQLRRKLGPLFTPRFLSRIVGDILEPELDAFRRQLGETGRADVVGYAERAAALVICRLTGYPADADAAAAQLARARELLRYAKLTTRRFEGATLAAMRAKLSELTMIARSAYREADAETVPGLLRSQGLGEHDAIAVISALVIAGTETIVAFLPRLAQLLITSGHLDRLADDPSGVDAAVNEGLRVTVPSPVMIRAVAEATTVGGRRVRPGDRIVLSTVMACNRAGDFDPDRLVPAEMRHLWFGAGAHFCIGMALATLEATTFAATLTDIHATTPLRIVSKRYKTRTIAASYQELILECTPS